MFCVNGAPGAGRLTLAGGTRSVASGCDGTVVVVGPAPGTVVVGAAASADDLELDRPSTAMLTARITRPTATMTTSTAMVRRRCVSPGPLGGPAARSGSTGCDRTRATTRARSMRVAEPGGIVHHRRHRPT